MEIRVDGKVAPVIGAPQGAGQPLAETLASSAASGLFLTTRSSCSPTPASATDGADRPGATARTDA